MVRLSAGQEKVDGVQSEAPVRNLFGQAVVPRCWQRHSRVVRLVPRSCRNTPEQADFPARRAVSNGPAASARRGCSSVWQGTIAAFQLRLLHDL